MRVRSKNEKLEKLQAESDDVELLTKRLEYYFLFKMASLYTLRTNARTN